MSSLARIWPQSDFPSRRFVCYLAALLACIVFAANMLFAHGAWLNVPQIRFTPATEAQINANIAAGNSAIMPNDIVELVAEFPSIVNGTLSGPNGYFTFYVPAGTEVVGASVVNAAFSDIPVRNATSAVSGAGISRGWGPKAANTFDVTANGWNPSPLPSPCTTYGRTAANCNSGLAHVYGDTGIFYSTRADTAFYTGDGSDLASLNNGYRVKPSNTAPWASLGGTGDARVHNKWDAVQSHAFGTSAALTFSNPGFSALEHARIISVGRGATPYKAGSPVAGPQSGNSLDRYGTTGPWQRISYPGSCIAQDGLDGPANSVGAVYPQPTNATPTSVAVCGATAGATVSEAIPAPAGTNAVRYAIGGIDASQTYRIKIRLRVFNPALIKAFNAEAAGGDSTQSAAADGNDNPWRYFVGGPGVAAPAYNGLLAVNKSIVAVNGSPYVAGSMIPPNATVRYRIGYANAGLTPHTNVQLTDILPVQSTATSNYTIISGPNIIPASPPATGTITFLPIAALAVGQGGGVEFDVALTAAAGAVVTNQARIVSTQRTTPVTSSVAATVSAINANLLVEKTSYAHETTGINKFSIPGADMVYSIKLTNRGDALTGNSIIIVDPLPQDVDFSLYPFDGSTTEPVKFVDGTGTAASGVVCCSSAHLQYSTDNGATYAYIPSTNSYNTSITHLRVAPAGQMTSGNSINTQFSIFFRVKIN
jgi:large repetitive protein